MSEYEPELGQAVFGNPTGEFSVSEIGSAAIEAALHEFRRVWGNVHQEECHAGDNYGGRYDIGGVTVRNYVWDEGSQDCDKPNMAFSKRPDIDIRWYKHSLRGLSCSREVTAEEWSQWLIAVIEELRAIED